MKKYVALLGTTLFLFINISRKPTLSMPVLPNFRCLPELNKKVYRSASFSFYSGEDIVFLKYKLKIKSFIDFRSEKELATHPVIEGDTLLTSQKLPIEVSKNFLLKEAGEQFDFLDYYMQILISGKEAFRELFVLLSDRKNLPLVFGCYSGKDRTGVFAILLLFLLEKPLHIIKKDFMASNAQLKKSIYLFKDKWERRGVTMNTYLKQIEVSERLFTRFNENLERIYKGAERYISRELLISPAMVIKIKNNLNQ